MTTPDTNASDIAGKPDTITAREFVEQKYHEKIKRGECTVIDYAKRPIQYRFPDSWGMYCFGISELANAAWLYEPQDKLTVTWLPAQASPEPTDEGGAGVTLLEECLNEIWRFADPDVGGADDINDADSYIEMLAGQMSNIRDEVTDARKELKHLQAANAALTSELEAAKVELGNYAVKSFEAFERVFEIELDHIPDPDELLYLWEQKGRELEAARGQVAVLREWIFDALSTFAGVLEEDEETIRATLEMLSKSAAKVLNTKATQPAADGGQE